MATFTGTTNTDVANATDGTLTGFSGGTVAELQDGVGDTFTGDAGSDSIIAGVGDDLIDAGAGDDLLNGNAGDDRLTGGLGNDQLFGLKGNDILQGGDGADALDGGAGVDIADYSDKTSSIVMTLNGWTNATVMVGGVAEDTIRNVEDVIGGLGADTLTGDSLDNALLGNDGDDLLVGGLGNDSLIGGLGNDALDAGDGADFVTGEAGADTLNGGAGADILIGGGGSDVLDGGAGVDWAFYDINGSLPNLLAVAVTLNGSVNAIVTIGGVAEDTIRNIENVAGGAGGDTLTGDGLNNFLFGNSGNDTLNGGGGDDILTGSFGDDTLDGGAGVDLGDYSDKSTSVVVTLNGATNAVVAVGGVAEDTIRNIENVVGGSGADTLTGDGLANLLRGGAESDVLDGGAGVDFADYSDKTSSVVVALNGSTNVAVTVGGVAEDTIRNFENILGGSGGDTLTGDGLANALGGGAGDDTLRGGLGKDTLDGGAGVDLAMFSEKTSSVVVTLNGSTNAIVNVGGVAEDTIRNVERVLGGSGGDALTGDALANGLAGGGGNDILKGGLGKDALDGGAGVDFADYRDKTSSIVVTLNGAANATVTVGGVAEDAIRNIENLLGGSGADTLRGDALANALAGGAGNDLLKGGLGKDALDGGAGVDVADYRDKTSSVVVTLNGATNAAVTVGGVAEDTIRNIENVLGGSAADTLGGDSLANAFAGGAGADRFVFKPAFGKDTIVDFSTSDKLVIDNAIFADFASVLGASQQMGSDTVITASATNTITLKNFAVANLTQARVEFF